MLEMNCLHSRDVAQHSYCGSTVVIRLWPEAGIAVVAAIIT